MDHNPKSQKLMFFSVAADEIAPALLISSEKCANRILTLMNFPCRLVKEHFMIGMEKFEGCRFENQVHLPLKRIVKRKIVGTVVERAPFEMVYQIG